MMFFLIGAFIAGMLTIVAPCVLPLLPVIIGGSVSGNNTDKRRPLIIAGSLAVSLVIFTLLLKATSLLINIPPRSIAFFSGGLIILIGLFTLFPLAYAKLIAKTGLEPRAQRVLSRGYHNQNGLVGPVITGAALGPVFSSCSPVYAYILATVLPANFFQAFAYIIAYVLGLSSLLLFVGYYGQRFVARIKFASNPKGWFQRSVAILFIVVGLLIFTGYDKKFQVFVSNHTPFNFDSLSSKLMPGSKRTVDDSKLLNVPAADVPELTGIEGWINSEPLTLEGLKGKVVLIDFWTYSCINCIRNNVYLEKWYEAYKDQGFVIIGVHAPEFAFEKVKANVEQGVHEQHITYPVALDNNLDTWNAFGNRSWPAAYLIDKDGQVRRFHEGEGGYNEEERAIRELLSQNGANLSDVMATDGSEAVPITYSQTPETYLGATRASNYAGSPYIDEGLTSSFSYPGSLRLNQWALSGKWEIQGEKIIARGNSKLKFRFAAKDMYLVMGSASAQTMGITLNGKPISGSGNEGQDVIDNKITVGDSRLYRLVEYPGFTDDGTAELSVPDGTELNAFTFGS